jgi:DNA polymerase III epsilon subunit-like protein
MSDKIILVMDFETDHKLADIANPIQIGAIAIDPIRYQVIPNSEFYSWVRPDLIDHPNYMKDHEDTLKFHCRNYNMSMEKLLEKIREAPSEKQVFENFTEYTRKYHTKESSQTIFSSPALAGFNALAFDFPILDRLCKKYGYVDKNGQQKLYFTRDTIDIMKVVMMWLVPTRELRSYSMDTLREYFGMAAGQAHDALFDVKEEAEILIKFLKLHKRFAGQIKFKGAFSPKEEVDAH